MIFRWLKSRRRSRLRARPFPSAWNEILERNFPADFTLSDVEASELRARIQIFIAEKNWEGCGGLELTEEIKVTIAAHACLLVLGMEEEYFDRVATVLVYPESYATPQPIFHEDGTIDESRRETLGEAWYRGPVILAWAEVLESARTPDDGRNVTIHEFAHKLDMLGGRIDGTPPLETAEAYRRWGVVMTKEYDRLVEASDRGESTLLDEYGTIDEGEFFAVASECFFEQSVRMSKTHPRLYGVLRDFYRQNPAARVRA